MNKQFVKGAWLYTTPEELSESEFIEKAGGKEALKPFSVLPYVTLVLSDPVQLRGHRNGRIISIQNSDTSHPWQTMEWKR